MKIEELCKFKYVVNVTENLKTGLKLVFFTVNNVIKDQITLSEAQGSHETGQS